MSTFPKQLKQPTWIIPAEKLYSSYFSGITISGMIKVRSSARSLLKWP